MNGEEKEDIEDNNSEDEGNFESEDEFNQDDDEEEKSEEKRENKKKQSYNRNIEKDKNRHLIGAEESDVEEVSDFSDEEEIQKTNINLDNNSLGLQELANKEHISTQNEDDVKNKTEEKLEEEKGNNDEKQEKNNIMETNEEVSSACLTGEISETFPDAFDDSDDNENNYSYEEDEEEDENNDDDINYDYLYEMNDENEENAELVNFKGFMAQSQGTEKILNNVKFLLRSQEFSIEAAMKEHSLEEWIEQVFFLFASNQKVDILSSADNAHEMDTYSLFYKFLILTLLDPIREATILPLLGLYLLEYDIKACTKLANRKLMKDKIVNFLHQYALRSPSIFFKTFSRASFDPYLSNKDLEKQSMDNFSILDVLFKFYMLNAEENKINKGLEILLNYLLHFLLQVRFLCKDEEIPAFIKHLRQNNEVPLKEEVIQQMFKICEKDSNMARNIELAHFCKWLEYLARMHQYRKEILQLCDKLLKTHIYEEKNKLTQFIKTAKLTLQKEGESTPDEKYYYNNFSSHMELHIPSILSVLSYIINDIPELESEVKSFVQETETFKIGLRDISLYYMEALELFSKLKDKNYLDFLINLKFKLKKMIEVPVQYYLYLTKMKELISGPKAMDNLIGHPPDLTRIPSDLDNPLLLERSYSSARNDTSNFQEILPQWMKKYRSFINSIFKISGTGEENLNLWIVKKFPWVLDFNVKEKILRDAFAERAQNEEENEEDEETTLYIRRKHILEDTLKEFEYHNQDGSLYTFRIEFVNEPGVDQGGLKKEWLNLLTKEIFDPNAGLFKLSPNMRTVHPNPVSIGQPGVMACFKLAGILTGLAIKEKIPIDVNFSKSFLKLLMGVQPNLNDLEDIEPEFMQSLSWMLTNDVTVLEQPFIYELDIFGIKISQELVDNGANTIVDELNKETYINKLCLSKTLKEVENQIENFKKGFFEIVPEELAKIFSCGELEILISGKSEIDIQDLMKYATYRELSKDSQLVQWFWEIVEIMDQNMLANLLFFITGSSKVPHGGFKDSPIILVKGPTDTSSLPIAHTCFSELEIPLYESKEQFYEKLFLAISEGKEGFYIA